MSKVLINRGQATFHVRREETKGETNDKGEQLKAPKYKDIYLAPGQSIEAADDEEHARLLNYHDIVDAGEAVPQHDEQIKALQARVAQLEDEKKQLEAAASSPRTGDEHPAGSQEGTGFNTGPAVPPEGMSLDDASTFAEKDQETGKRKAKKRHR